MTSEEAPKLSERRAWQNMEHIAVGSPSNAARQLREVPFSPSTPPALRLKCVESDETDVESFLDSLGCAMLESVNVPSLEPPLTAVSPQAPMGLRHFQDSLFISTAGGAPPSPVDSCDSLDSLLSPQNARPTYETPTPPSARRTDMPRMLRVGVSPSSRRAPYSDDDATECMTPLSSGPTAPRDWSAPVAHAPSDASTGEQSRVQQELFAAAAAGDLHEVVHAVVGGADVTAPNGDGSYCICEAVLAGAGDLVERLIGFGADVNCRGTDEQTPLWLAAYTGNARILSMLLKKGAGASLTVRSNGLSPKDVATSDECRFIIAAAVKRARAHSTDMGC